MRVARQTLGAEQVHVQEALRRLLGGQPKDHRRELRDGHLRVELVQAPRQDVLRLALGRVLVSRRGAELCEMSARKKSENVCLAICREDVCERRLATSRTAFAHPRKMPRSGAEAC